MITWAARRRLLYISSIFIPLFLIVAVVSFVVWYEEPTCFDGKRNGDELGVDCGGSCRLLCQSQSLPPEILWSRGFQVVPGVYNLVAYIENPNIQSQVDVAPYSFKVYDQNNQLILERTGTTEIPQRKTFAIFEGTVRLPDGISPSRVTFEFTRELYWQRVSAQETPLEVLTTTLVGTDSSPRIDAVIENKSVVPINSGEAIAIIFDSANNAIHSSRTIFEDLGRGQTRRLVFTWPEAFDAGVGVCANPVDVALVIDRSGSMSFDGENPPEPLTTTKEAAKVFAGVLNGEDSLAVVSFANEGSLDQVLTSSMSLAQNAIDTITIGPDTLNQHTNIFDGLQVAFSELTSERDDPDADNIVVLLTDGVASRPLDESNPNFSVESAISISQQIKNSGAEIYTIGLGQNIDDQFLKTIATEEQYYYNAPEREDLLAIYEQIATAICTKGPNIIQIIPRVLE